MRSDDEFSDEEEKKSSEDEEESEKEIHVNDPKILLEKLHKRIS